MQQVPLPVRNNAAKCFAVDAASLKWMGGTDGSVYSVRKGSREYVLKIVPVQADQIPSQQERLAYIRYLAEHDTPVALPEVSEAGQYYELVSEGDQCYIVTLTLHADGRVPTPRNLYVWNETLFQVWGRAMGKMHALAKQYPKWRTEDGGTALGDFRSEHTFFANWSDDEQVTKRWWELLPALEALPVERNGYGLVHNDLHNNNFLYNPNARAGWTMTIIDFDVCGYSWFISDIAVAIYHAVAWRGRSAEERRAHARVFHQAFMAGYNLENTLDDSWWQHLPVFLRYRDFVLYTAMSHEWDKDKRAPWQVQYLTSMRRRIMTGKVLI